MKNQKRIAKVYRGELPDRVPFFPTIYTDHACVACGRRFREALIDKAVAISIELVHAFIATGVDCVYMGDSYASASVISPEIYERFCAPAYREMAEEIHGHGVFCYKHCCGYYDPLLQSLPKPWTGSTRPAACP